ncbi:hypothetical protein TGCAST_390060, partial [Toxoplasma gondii CAST]
ELRGHSGARTARLVLLFSDGAGCLHTVPRHLVSVCTFQPPSVGGQEFDVDAEIRERCLGARA